MYRPVLITAADRPVSVEAALRQCRITVDRDDDGNVVDQEMLDEVTALMEGYIDAAVEYLNGWNGVLGACVGEQVWAQEFDGFERCLPLPLGPVIEIDSVTFRNEAGQLSTIGDAEYALVTDGAGDSVLRFRSAYAFPSAVLHELRPVKVNYRCGYNPVPAPLRQAILLMVGAWYENREDVVIGTIAAGLPGAVAVDRLIAPYRRMVV